MNKNAVHKFIQTSLLSGAKKRKKPGVSGFCFAYNICIPVGMQHEQREKLVFAKDMKVGDILDVDLPKFMNGTEKSMCFFRSCVMVKSQAAKSAF